MKSKELEARELESIIQTLSHKSDTTTTQRTKLEKEKEMLRRVSGSWSRVIANSARRHQLRRQREDTRPGAGVAEFAGGSIDEGQGTGECGAEASACSEAWVKCENEKMAAEKRANKEIAEIRGELEEKDEEIRRLADYTLFSDLHQRLDAPAATGDDNTPAHVERLLGAIDRLRGERTTSDVILNTSKWNQSTLLKHWKLNCTSLRSDSASAPQENSTSIARFDSSISSVEAERDELLRQSEQQNEDWSKAFEELKSSKKKVQESLEEVQARLDDITQSLEDTESERDSLRLQVTNLNRDLIAAQEELEESEGRYSNLQHHQLDAMTDNEATRSLRDQVHELEGRVMRRTEQIGVHQHDIKRLETNLLLHEERLTEMTMEMETLAAQKDAMVEDCASAREARDESLLEVEVERLESQAEQTEGTVVELIAIIVDTVARSRASINASGACGQQTNVKLTARLELKDGELQELASLHKCTVAQLEEKIECCDNSRKTRLLQGKISGARRSSRYLAK
ncbi:Wd40 containing snare-dependent exocytosis protein [Salix suchowensis]|nr:Wd40 containing snare-dependent exocytosis protein [Salix suchowensis]